MKAGPPVLPPSMCGSVDIRIANPQAVGSSRGKASSWTCWTCQGLDHQQRDCPKGKGKGKGRQSYGPAYGKGQWWGKGGQAGSVNEQGTINVSDLCSLKTREPRNPKVPEKQKPTENAKFFRFTEEDVEKKTAKQGKKKSLRSQNVLKP